MHFALQPYFLRVQHVSTFFDIFPRILTHFHACSDRKPHLFLDAGHWRDRALWNYGMSRENTATIWHHIVSTCVWVVSSTLMGCESSVTTFHKNMNVKVYRPIMNFESFLLKFNRMIMSTDDRCYAIQL